MAGTGEEASTDDKGKKSKKEREREKNKKKGAEKEKEEKPAEKKPSKAVSYPASTVTVLLFGFAIHNN